MTEDEMNRFIASLSLATPEPEFNVRNLPSAPSYRSLQPDTGMFVGGGGERDVSGDYRNVAIQPGFRAGPVSGSATVATGRDMPTPGVGYSVNTELPSGFNAGYRRMHAMEAPSRYDQHMLSLAREVLGSNVSGSVTEQDGRRGFGAGVSRPLGGGGNAFINAQRDPRGGHAIMGGMDMRFSRGGYADGGDAEVQSNGMPVISDGQVNWGDSSNAADFVRADQAMRAMRSAPDPQAAPMPMQRSAPAPAPYSAPRDVPLPPVRPANLGQPIFQNSSPEGPGAYNPDDGFPARPPGQYADPAMLFDPDMMAKGFTPPLEAPSAPPPASPPPPPPPGASDWRRGSFPQEGGGKYTNRAMPLTPPVQTPPSTDELLALLSNPTQSVASAAIDQAAPVAKFTDRAAPGISMTPQQRDLIIRTIAAESSGKTPEEGQGIANVILNRIASGRYGKTPEKVLFAPKQFEPWADPRGSNYPMRHKPGTTKYEKAQDALEAAMGGDDITGGATLFWGPKAQAALGRPAPKWGRTGGLDIGETRFHRDDGGMVVEREAHQTGKRVVSTALEALRARAIPRVNPTEAADRVAFLLRNGRGNEVTNELAGAADPNTLLQHYLSGGTGAEMPMGQAARIGRAKEMGYHTEKPYYHAGDPKTAFDNSRGELYVTTDKPFAEAYRADKDYGDIRSLLSRHQNTIEGDDVVDFFHNKVSSLDPSGVNIKYGWQAFNPDHLAAAGGDPRDAAKLLPALKREGFDSAFFPEDFPPTSSYTDPSSSRAIFYPETLRDISARFDPRMSHVSDLDYASGGEVSEGNNMDSHIARALYLARGGYATPGFVDDQPEEEYPDGARPLTIYRNPNRAAPAGAMDASGDQGPSYDQMGNITSPGRNADPIVDAAMRAIPARSYAKDPELLAQEIQDYKRKVAEREATPEYYRQMTHYNISPPLAPVEIEGGFIGKRAIGEAPYDNAEARSKFFQTLYDMKTLPLYAAGSVFPPAAGLGMALDTAEGVAAGSPTQVAMGAFGAPGKVMKYGAAPLIAATGMLSPDEAQAAKLPKIGKAASGIAHAATPGGEMSLEQAMDIAKKAGSASARGKQAAPDEVSGLFDYSRLQEVPKVQQFNLPRNIPARGIPERVTELTVDPNVRSKMAEVISRGREMGGANWYNTDPLRDRFIQQLGAGAGDAAHRKFMDFVAATSPRSKVGENVRNASYYYGRDIRGEGMPAVGDKNPQPYGHMAQRLHQMNAERVAGVGWDPLNNPKPASFVENLVGNQQPATIDTHAFRLPAILAQDPRFLETAYLASKDAPKLNIQKMVNSGEMTLEDALKTPAYWQAQPKANEYGAMERYYQSIGRELGLTPAQTQASAWVGGGKLTGLGSDESKPFLRFFDDRIMKTAQERNMDPKDVLREFITGKSSLYADGGSVVDRALMLLSKQGR